MYGIVKFTLLKLLHSLQESLEQLSDNTLPLGGFTTRLLLQSNTHDASSALPSACTVETNVAERTAAVKNKLAAGEIIL